MTDRTNKLFLMLCLLAVYLNVQVWILGLNLTLKILSSLLSNSIIMMFGLYLFSQRDVTS